MTAAESLLAELHGAGVSVAAGPDGTLACRPRSALTDELRAAIRAHKAALLALLADPLATWLAQPVPTHVEPLVECPTIADLEALGERLGDWLEAGEAAMAAAPADHPRLAEGRRRFEERLAAYTALGHLVAALSGRPYDRHQLGTWAAGQAFRADDMPTVLAIVDAIQDGSKDGIG